MNKWQEKEILIHSIKSSPANRNPGDASIGHVFKTGKKAQHDWDF